MRSSFKIDESPLKFMKKIFSKITESTSHVRAKTALVNILVIIALPFFIYLGYKDGIWSMLIVCLIIFPFALRNAYRYFFNAEFRKEVNKGHDDERALPKEERYLTQCYETFMIGLKIIGIALLLYAIFGLCVFFNLI